MEFEENNQMGETGICEESTDNEIATVSLEARGREEEDVSSKIQQTQTNLDIATMLKLLTQQMAENTKQVKQLVTENMEQLKQQMLETPNN